LFIPDSVETGMCCGHIRLTGDPLEWVLRRRDCLEAMEEWA
jgi:hypothetical protein